MSDHSNDVTVHGYPPIGKIEQLSNVPPAYSVEQRPLIAQMARLEREKQLLHERVEELERGKSPEIIAAQVPDGTVTIGTPIGWMAIRQEEYESLKADAEKWRLHTPYIEAHQDIVSDAELGALVRKMLPDTTLARTPSGQWKVYGRPDTDWLDSPEEALRATRSTLGEPK